MGNEMKISLENQLTKKLQTASGIASGSRNNRKKHKKVEFE